MSNYIITHIIIAIIVFPSAILIPKNKFIRRHVSTNALDLFQGLLLVYGFIYGIVLTLGAMLTNSPASWLPF